MPASAQSTTPSSGDEDWAKAGEGLGSRPSLFVEMVS